MTLPLSSLARLMGHTALVACLIPAATLAQTTETELETVVLDGSASGSAPVEGANPATATGSKMAVPVTEIPQSVSVIGAATLAAENVTKVDGALAYAAGVQAQPYGYDSDTNWFFVRGFAATATGPSSTACRPIPTVSAAFTPIRRGWSGSRCCVARPRPFTARPIRAAS